MRVLEFMDDKDRARYVAALALCALFGPACSEAGPDRAYAEQRVVDAELRPARAGASNSDRFNQPDPHAGNPHAGGVDGQSGAVSGAPAPSMRWATPEGWTELAPTSMRLANLMVEGDAGKAECYLSVLPGDAGGDVANVDRWRGQMGLAPLGQAGLADLERRTLLGQEALLVELEGDFTAMDGSQQEGARLLGMILSVPTGTLFVKMTGPGDLLEAEREHFLEFCDSVYLDTGEHSDGTAGQSEPPAPTSSDSAPSAGLQWQAPEEWKQAGPRPMREVSFELGADGTECYVAVLPGAAGGVAPNLQRWRSQLGLEPLESAELDALERIEVLGVESPMMEAYGRYEGMDGKAIEEGGMLGLVCTQGSQTVFVKLIGTAETVRASGDKFRAFCESLEWKP